MKTYINSRPDKKIAAQLSTKARRGVLEIVPCIACGAEHARQTRSDSLAYTELRCKSCVASKRIGRNAANWKGGIVPLTKQVRDCDKYQDWRKSIFEQDNYTCQGCGKRGVRLEADHHPRLFSEIFAAYLESEVGDYLDYSDFWEASGRAVCRPCHNTIGRRPKTYTLKEKTLKNVTSNSTI